jgi:hypothetical protein
MDFATIFVLIFGVITGTFLFVGVFCLIYFMDEPKVVKPKAVKNKTPLTPIRPTQSRIKRPPNL